MSKTINYTALEQELVKITHLSNIASVISWDAATGLPKGSAENRHQEMATLNSVIHEIFTSQNLGELVEKADQEKENLDDWQKANLEIIKKSYISQTCISSEDQHEYSIASSDCEFIWRKARCLIPDNYGVYYEDNDSWRKSLWDKYCTQMPEQRRQSVERSVIVKRA
ncbi:MAG: hypothetical protein EKK61_01075 [Rickettsiales bacterium]|nr:MAG: hypothetical protein EKK61_01075 [Rickettsiales bacterium]